MSSKATKLTDKPKLHKRVLDFTNYKALPAIAKATIIVAGAYGVTMAIINYSPLPSTLDSATIVVLYALVLKLASRKVK